MKVKIQDNPQLTRFLAEIEALQGKVGWAESAKYPDGKPVAFIASIHEFGAASRGIPPRSFMRTALPDAQRAVSAGFAIAVKKAVNGEGNAETAMTLTVEIARGFVHKQLSKMGNYADDNPVVKRRRGRKNPPPNQSTAILRDTLTMFNTLTGWVEKK